MRYQKIIFLIIFLAVVITAASFFVGENLPQKETFLSPEIIQPASFLNSLYGSEEAYENVFANLPKTSAGPDVLAGIVSHHFLAKQFIADFYNEIGNEKVFTVFLISPDHYNVLFPAGTIAYASKMPWKTPFGDIFSDKEAINSLIARENVMINDSAMGLEHGISVEIPFVKNFFPNAKIVPIVVKNNYSYEKLFDLGKKLKGLTNEKSILIVSSDFSHDATQKTAKANDKKSLEILRNLSLDKISEVTSDCVSCLAVMSGYLPNPKDYKFSLIGNKDSSDFLAGAEKTVTSYVSGFYEIPNSVQILFVGDLMFDRGIRYYAQNPPAGGGENNFIFEKVSNFLQNNDLVLANLEGPITDSKSVSSDTKVGSTDNTIFTFDKSLAKTLFEENIKLVNLANNHILNFGQKGIDSTEKYLDSAHVSYFGAPGGEKSTIKEVDGVKFGFVSYNEFVAKPSLEQISAINEIISLKEKADIVVVFCHWGKEYFSEPSQADRELAHKFVDAGAGLVIGSHPHVIVPMEVYKNKRIYYSLGNFIFDQYFSENVRKGLGVVLSINKQTKQMSFEEKNFYLEINGQTSISE